MRAYHFLTEAGLETSIQDQLSLLLTTLHANDVPNVSIKQIRQSLENAGFYVNRKWIQDNARQLGVVKDVDEQEITLDIETSEPEPEAPEAQDDQKTVEKMAKNALSRRQS
jgi:hypothetical protein